MKRIITGQFVVEWVAKRTNEHGNFGCATGLGLQRFNGEVWELIGGVAYNEFNGVNINMHVAASEKGWLTRRFLWSAFHYPFEHLKVKRVTGLVGEGNTVARQFDEALGFRLETTLKHAHPTGDLLVYCMFKEDCRWLKLFTLEQSSILPLAA